MVMDILFITDPITTLQPHHDTSLALMVAAQQQGHQVWNCTVMDLYVEAGECATCARPLMLTPDQIPLVGAEQCFPLSRTPVVFMRKDPPVDRQYLLATYLLDRVNPQKTLVVNRPTGLRQANEKMYTLNFSQYMPETLVSACAKDIVQFLEIHEKAVLKPLDGKGGEGIFLLQPQDRNLKALIEISTQGHTIPVMVQRYLPESRAGDKRIILLAGKPLGAVLRVPAADDVRGNLRVGGKAVAAEITPHEAELCAHLAPRLIADGLYFVGLDVIGAYLTEVNVTSPTGIQEIDQLSGRQLGNEVIAWATQYQA